MKLPRHLQISLAATTLILAGTAGFAWLNQREISKARVNYQQLITAAAKAGVPLKPFGIATPLQYNRGKRIDQTAAAKLAATEFIAFAREIAPLREQNTPLDDALKKRQAELTDRLMALDGGQIEILMEDVRAATDIPEKIREEFLIIAVGTFAKTDPQAGLDLVLRSLDLFHSGGSRRTLLSSILANWSGTDPASALDWIRETKKAQPALFPFNYGPLIDKAVGYNPAIAFQMVTELEMTQGPYTYGSLMSAANKAGQRDAALTAYRAHRTTLTDDKIRAAADVKVMTELVNQVARDGFESGSHWMETAHFSPEEFTSLVKQHFYTSEHQAESGRWIEWIAKQVSIEEAQTNIESTFGLWTMENPAGSEAWLKETPAGPVKDVAIQEFINVMVSRQPQIAGQWAADLPAGEIRDQTLNRVHERWSRNDPAAAEAFAKQHGLK